MRFFLSLDTDECANNPCNQWCKNTNGGYICHCHKGYELQGKNTCVGRLNQDIPCQTSLRHLKKCQLVTRFFLKREVIFQFSESPPPPPHPEKTVLEYWIYFGWVNIMILLAGVGRGGGWVERKKIHALVNVQSVSKRDFWPGLYVFITVVNNGYIHKLRRFNQVLNCY